MKTKDLQNLMDVIESEGFDYALTYYSSFKEIKDDEFHSLRIQFLRARGGLQHYIGIKQGISYT